MTWLHGRVCMLLVLFISINLNIPNNRLSEKRKHLMRLHHRVMIGMLLSSTAALIGCNSEAPPAAPEAPKVTVQHPEARTLTDYEEFNGWLAPDKKVEIRARVRGNIKKVHFTDGKVVKKGQLLFQLDPRPFEADIGRHEDKLRVFEA